MRKRKGAVDLCYFCEGVAANFNPRKEKPDISLDGRSRDILIDLLGAYRNGAGLVRISTSKTSL